VAEDSAVFRLVAADVVVEDFLLVLADFLPVSVGFLPASPDFLPPSGLTVFWEASCFSN
jgi:hypothetical protein